MNQFYECADLSPEISVVIPTYNRPEMLSICIKYYLELDCLTELIIINDHSKSEIDSVITPFLGNKKLTYITHTERKGSSYSFNEGAQIASAPIVFFAQDDLLISKESLKNLRELFNKKIGINYGCIGGSVFSVSFEVFKLLANGTIRTMNFYSAASGRVKLPHLSVFTGEVAGSFSAFSTSGPTKMLCGVFAVSKDVFLAVGGFDYTRYVGNHYREETDFHLRLLRKGFHIYYEPNIIGFHCHQQTGGQRSNKLVYELYVLRNHAFFLSRFFGLKTLVMLPLFALNRIAYIFLTSRFNKIVPSEYFQMYLQYPS